MTNDDLTVQITVGELRVMIAAIKYVGKTEYNTEEEERIIDKYQPVIVAYSNRVGPLFNDPSSIILGKI